MNLAPGCLDSAYDSFFPGHGFKRFSRLDVRPNLFGQLLNSFLSLEYECFDFSENNCSLIVYRIQRHTVLYVL